MARYIQNVTLNKPDDFVQFIMNDFLQKNAFTLADWKGEPAYRAGDPMFEGYKYLKWSYQNGVFHLEAWLKGTFGGEWDLEGFVGIAMKKPYKSNLEQLIGLLQQDISQPVNTQTSTNADGTVQTTNVVSVQTLDDPGAATLALVFGILAIVFAFLIPLLSIVFGCLAISRARVGMHSSKGGQAKAGKICAIVGMCIGIGLWLLNIFLSVILALLS
ncbi:MAG: hypothetical protein J6C84_04390 [Lachnospiraceae bacterium]|nr:hypothetical protein [Lachnospiraceae bacterium]